MEHYLLLIVPVQINRKKFLFGEIKCLKSGHNYIKISKKTRGKIYKVKIHISADFIKTRKKPVNMDFSLTKQRKTSINMFVGNRLEEYSL